MTGALLSLPVIGLLALYTSYGRNYFFDAAPDPGAEVVVRLGRPAMALGFLPHSPRFGAIIANGQGSMEGQIFRMAHLGYFDFADMFGIIAGLELILRANGHRIDGREVELGKGVAAVQRVYEAHRPQKAAAQ